MLVCNSFLFRGNRPVSQNFSWGWIDLDHCSKTRPRWVAIMVGNWVQASSYYRIASHLCVFSRTRASMDMLTVNEVIYLLKSSVLGLYCSKALSWALWWATYKGFSTCWELTMLGTPSFNPHNNSMRSGLLLSLFRSGRKQGLCLHI